MVIHYALVARVSCVDYLMTSLRDLHDANAQSCVSTLTLLSLCIALHKLVTVAPWHRTLSDVCVNVA